jgi:two-component system response regulator RegX3
VLQADNGETGLEIVARERPRLAIVDIGLPGRLDGFDVCRRLRSGSPIPPAGAGTTRTNGTATPASPPASPGAGHGPGLIPGAAPGPGAAGDPGRRRAAETATLPILILSARDDEVDRVLGLELGADDYVTKPFSARELVARVHAILRRAGMPQAAAAPTVFTVGPIEVDTGRREARVAGTVVPLATQEFDLLSYLVDNVGLALSRRQLLNGAWGDDWYGDERTVDVHVRQLRKKLGPDLPLATVWGVGYRLG